MDYRLKKQLSTFTLFVIGSLTIGSLYQNCSKVAVTDLASEEKALEAERIALARDSETITAGLNPVPDLKMFFVVDNSGTMKANQLNLAQSFGAMFDQTSKDSLSKFRTSAYLISTAQKSPLLSDQSTLDSIATKQSYYDPLSPLTLDIFKTSYRTDELNSGYLPGDNLGFKLSKSSSPLSYTFSPAPVLGWADQSSTLLTGAIHREALDLRSDFENQFKDRLAVLDSTRIPLVSANGVLRPENATIVDSESGLCSVARVLREPEGFLKSGDLFSFILVSDENDNDPGGNNCILKQTRHRGDIDLFDGVCEQKQTAIKYRTTVTTDTAAKCRINGSAGYKTQFSYSENNDKTIVTYKAVSQQAKYKTPKTDIKYFYKVPKYSLIQTQVKYFTKTCIDIISDGIVVGENCQYSSSPITSAWVTGDFSNSCYSLAQTQNSKATNDSGKMPVCNVQNNVVGNCDTSNVNCKLEQMISSTTKTTTVMGALTLNQATTTAQSYSDYWPNSAVSIVNGFYAETTTPCTTQQTAAGCVMSAAATFTSTTKEVSGDKTADGCLSYAKSQSGNAVSTLADITQCRRDTSLVNKTLNVNVPFSKTQSADGGSTLANNSSSCGAISNIALLEAQKTRPTLTATNVCAITGTYAFSQVEQVSTTECSVQANSYCSTNNFRACSASFVAGSTNSSQTAETLHTVINEDLSCSSLCRDSKLGLCGSSPSVANLTIADYLKSVYGSSATCSEVRQTIAGSQTVVKGLTAVQEQSICKPLVNSTPTYYRRTSSGPYRLETDVVEHVAGSVYDGSSYKPAKNLIDYITERSKELSQINPIYSALVRTSTDVLGNGGSAGLAYEELIQKTSGSVSSVLSNDYSPALQSLSKVIKNALERSFVLQKMRPDQVIFRVHKISKDTNESETLDSSLWKQSGITITLHESLEFKDGDQFRVEFQNNLNK